MLNAGDTAGDKSEIVPDPAEFSVRWRRWKMNRQPEVSGVSFGGCSGSSEVHIKEPRLCWGIVVGEAGDMGQPSVLYKLTMGYK